MGIIAVQYRNVNLYFRSIFPIAIKEILDLHDRAIKSQENRICPKHGCKTYPAEMTGAGPYYSCSQCEDEENKALDDYWRSKGWTPNNKEDA